MFALAKVPAIVSTKAYGKFKIGIYHVAAVVFFFFCIPFKNPQKLKNVLDIMVKIPTSVSAYRSSTSLLACVHQECNEM